jgi:hypothetical protein
MMLGSGCSSGDPSAKFIAEMEAAPPEKRVPNWEKTKALMARRAPAVGEPAPDFTLKSADGQTTITRSTYQAGKPMVLIFGSFT